METPRDLLEKVYTQLQNATTQRPGPVLSRILKKAGILIQPPTSKPVPIVRETNTAAAAAGGAIALDKVQILAIVSVCFPLIVTALANGDTQTANFILAGLVGLGILQTALLRADTPNRIRARQRQAIQEVEEEAGLLDITKVPSSGTMDIPRDTNDPVTFSEIQVGDKIAIVKGETRQPILVDSLQGWIAARINARQPAEHPITKALISSVADVKVYTVGTLTGGRRRKTSKRKMRRRMTRKRNFPVSK